MRTSDSYRGGGWLDGRFDDFDRRLKAILGEGRIPRHEKRAKARQAMRAVDDLIDGIAEDLGQTGKGRRKDQ